VNSIDPQTIRISSPFAVLLALAVTIAARIDSAAAPGDLDTTFAPPFYLTSLPSSPRVSAIVLQPDDGRILVVGAFDGIASLGASRNIARLHGDGRPDASFQSSLSVGEVFCMAMQPDGKILVGGEFTRVGTVTRNRIARLNSDGSLDASFLDDLAGPNSAVKTIALQPDGRVLIGGSFQSVNGVERAYLARLNSDGTVDRSFYEGFQGPNGDVACIALQPDGKVLVGGRFYLWNGAPRNILARLKPDGSPDSAFQPSLPSAGFADGALSLRVQDDGRIVVAGITLVRLNIDGTQDINFVQNLGIVNGYVASVAVQPNGKIVIGGNFTQVGAAPRNGIARLNADGSVDSLFLRNMTGANVLVSPKSVSVQPDGKVLVGGTQGQVNGVMRYGLTRLLPATRPLLAASITDGLFSFVVLGDPQQPVVIQTSGDLTNWLSVHTDVLLEGGSQLFRPQEGPTNAAYFIRVFSP
jgi:uncharacterized delta-60 repeat protein